MKLIFEGWDKVKVGPHEHVVTPLSLVDGKLAPDKTPGPITWTGPLEASGRVTGLGLSGNFLVEFNFEPEELKNWLKEYVKAEPEAALRLLAEMQAEAILALTQKATKVRVSKRTP